MKILIVGKSKTSQAILRKILESSGSYLLVFADSVPLAYDSLDIDGVGFSADPIEQILMDLEMPRVNGIEDCKRIKFTPGLSDIPVFMLERGRDYSLDT